MLKDISFIELSGKMYPMKMNNIVLQKIQESYGTIKEFELLLMGWEEKDGKIVRLKEPSVIVANWILPIMIEEGFAVMECEMNMTKEEIVRKIDMPMFILADKIHEELKKAFQIKKEQPNQMIQNQIRMMEQKKSRGKLTLIGCMCSAYRLWVSEKKR